MSANGTTENKAEDAGYPIVDSLHSDIVQDKNQEQSQSLEGRLGEQRF